MGAGRVQIRIVDTGAGEPAQIQGLEAPPKVLQPWLEVPLHGGVDDYHSVRLLEFLPFGLGVDRDDHLVPVHPEGVGGLEDAAQVFRRQELHSLV
ncbi:MAG TPA: hypothetical protein VG457_15225 [Planctomycetota bacterium]|nr:hypothetical protein [Planctomycetota bacterium]